MVKSLIDKIIQKRIILVLSLLAIMLSTVFMLGYFIRHEPRSKTDFPTNSLSWVKNTNEFGDTYRISSTKASLLVSCQNKKMKINTLEAMSIVRVEINNGEFPIYNLAINSKNYLVPTINDNPNPTEEQIKFMRLLVKAKLLSFEFDNTKFVWPVKNSNILSDCISLK